MPGATWFRTLLCYVGLHLPKAKFPNSLGARGTRLGQNWGIDVILMGYELLITNSDND